MFIQLMTDKQFTYNSDNTFLLSCQILKVKIQKFEGGRNGDLLMNHHNRKMHRTQKTALNSIVGLGCSVISSLLSFVLRALFIRLLGLEYAGINTLFADILNILNLADLGFSNAIMFRLYKTISDDDKEKTEMYLTLYRKICYIIGIIVAVAGLCCVPFLGSLVKELPNFKEPMWSLYLITLATSVANNFINYKSILIIVEQDRYISTIIQYGCIFLRNGLQIVSLIVYKNIYIYLLIPLFTTVLNGVLNGIFSERKYRMSWHSKEKIAAEERRLIVKDVGALSVYKLCRTIDATVDTFLISRFVDVATTAIYGSVTVLLNALNELLGVFNDAMLASVGDLNASGNKNRLESIFYESFHSTFLAYGICTATLVPFISQFTKWWIGYTLEQNCLYLMLLNFFMYGIGMNVATFRNAMGIFRKGWVRPAVTALLNLCFSVVLVLKVGLAGTLIGTFFARLFTLVWYDPWLVLHHGMQKKVSKFYIRYVMYSFFTLIASLVGWFVCSHLPEPNGFFAVVFFGCISFMVAVTVLLLLGFLVPEQKKVILRLKSIIPHKLSKGKNYD